MSPPSLTILDPPTFTENSVDHRPPPLLSAVTGTDMLPPEKPPRSPAAPSPLVETPLEESGADRELQMVDVPLEDADADGRLVVVPHDEVVRLDLSELPDEEAEAILDVLGKDSVFRAEEKGRIE